MNKTVIDNINFNMNEDNMFLDNKKNIFKELIIQYLIRNIFGEKNDN